MEQLKETAQHYHDGMITAGEFLYRIVTLLARETETIEITIVQHDLADKLSTQLLK